jgi:hypothetical protein
LVPTTCHAILTFAAAHTATSATVLHRIIGGIEAVGRYVLQLRPGQDAIADSLGECCIVDIGQQGSGIGFIDALI